MTDRINTGEILAGPMTIKQYKYDSVEQWSPSANSVYSPRIQNLLTTECNGETVLTEK